MRRAHIVPWVLVLGAAAAQQDFSKVEVKVTPVGGAVSMLTGSGGNIGVSVGENGVLLVDDEFAPLKERILAAVATLHEPSAPRFVLNTHFHGDHTGGNAGMAAASGPAPGAIIVAQENVRRRMVHGGGGQPPAEPAALPVVTYGEGIDIHFNGELIRLLHVAHAHTDGDTVVIFTGSNVAHLGDLFFNGMFPFVDLSSGGDVVGMARGVEQMLAQLPAGGKLIPGHGPLATIEDLRKYHRMLTETTQIVRERMAAGKTKDEVVAAGLPDEWKSWSWQFVSTDRWLGTVFDSLKAAPDGPPAGH